MIACTTKCRFDSPVDSVRHDFADAPKWRESASPASSLPLMSYRTAIVTTGLGCPATVITTGV